MTKSVARHFDSVARNVHHHNMAKTVSVVVTDDLDGTPDAETVAFSVEGQSYEIDLSQKNLARLQKSLQPFVDAGRRTTVRKAARSGRSAVRVDRAAVRAWANAQGLQVSERGRISAEVMSKYEAAH
jgi:hypothetical protein